MAGSNECVLKHCPSRYGVTKEKINLFRFPKDIERCKEWATACGQLRLFECKMSCGESLYNSYYRVCSLHFECSMFAGVRKKRLHIDAVPTLFLDKNQPDSEPLNRPTGSCSTQKEDSILRKYMLMDVIKMESEVDPLAVQLCDDAIKEEANPSPDEGNMLDLQVTRIKEECVDDSYDHNPEIKFEEIILPNNFPVVKCEPEEELCDLDTVKDELDLEVTAGEKEIFPNSVVDNVEKSVSLECTGIYREEDKLPQYDSSRPDISEMSHNSVKCHICHEVFITSESMKLHSHVHTMKKPFKCDVCGKYFTRSWNLKVHTRVHTEENPFKCEVCGKCFSDPTGLSKHSRIHTGERPFKCDVCGKFFRESSNLKFHVRLHTGERPFKCDQCRMCFTSKAVLKRHSRIHTGEKTFKCNVCGKCFAGAEYFKIHARQHTEERPFKCSEREKNSADIGSL
ncbi:zinc finger protein 813-like [Periplaneta americana]|uniref:zinc finger protein 813-like n=1 Tax=Periplaneta americana TaxID=6978 RepID=UPI0037E77131